MGQAGVADRSAVEVEFREIREPFKVRKLLVGTAVVPVPKLVEFLEFRLECLTVTHGQLQDLLLFFLSKGLGLGVGTSESVIDPRLQLGVGASESVIDPRSQLGGPSKKFCGSCGRSIKVPLPVRDARDVTEIVDPEEIHQPPGAQGRALVQELRPSIPSCN